MGKEIDSARTHNKREQGRPGTPVQRGVVGGAVGGKHGTKKSRKRKK
jgi:hypothetical protein